MKRIPDEKQIESMLEHLAPPISGRLDERLSNAPWMQPEPHSGETMNRSQPRVVRRLAFASLMIVVLLSLALVTPPGRAFAQDIMKFFRRAESNVFPLSPDQIVPPEEVQSMPTAAPPAPLVSVPEAERSAGFDAKELPLVPKGFEFAGAMGLPGSITIEYQAQGGGGALVINEATDGFMQSDWDQAPVEAISQVQVGDLQAEIVQGGFVVYPDEPTSARWNPELPILRLRWISDGLWIEMVKFGGVEAIEYLDQDAMIDLAESLTNDPFPLEVSEAEAHARFDVLEPGTLPEGMTFLGSSLDPALKMVSLSFGYSEADRRLLIKQQPAKSIETCDLCGLVGASASVEPVQIGDAPGEYALGVWELTENGPVWRDDPYLRTIRWQKDGMAYEMIYMGMEVEKEDLITIAEGLQ